MFVCRSLKIRVGPAKWPRQKAGEGNRFVGPGLWLPALPGGAVAQMCFWSILVLLGANRKVFRIVSGDSPFATL